MANEQTSVPLYAASEVLTAANMNISAGTGVPVFATTVTRDAAFGGAGEKVLAEGQLCYLSASNIVQYYDGAAWATVGPSSAGALTFINGATFTTVASVSMAASTFTSTYTNYLVTLNITVSSVDQNISLRVNSAGAARTTSDYYGEKVSSTTAQASSGVSSVNFAAVRNTAPFVSHNIFVFNPASATSKTNLHGQGTGFPNGGAAGVVNIDFAALYDVAEANDGLTFLVGGTFTGSYKVYGLANS